MVHPIFKEYSAMDNIIKGLVREIPIERSELISLMEMDWQSQIHTVLFLLGLCGTALCIMSTFVF